MYTCLKSSNPTGFLDDVALRPAPVGLSEVVQQHELTIHDTDSMLAQKGRCQIGKRELVAHASHSPQHVSRPRVDLGDLTEAAE